MVQSKDIIMDFIHYNYCMEYVQECTFIYWSSMVLLWYDFDTKTINFISKR